MVHGVNGPNGINNDVKIKLNYVETTTSVNSAWGDGFASTNGVSVERNIPGLDALLNKFGFETPAYEKNIAQLKIDNRYYIPDQPFDENKFCEV